MNRTWALAQGVERVKPAAETKITFSNPNRLTRSRAESCPCYRIERAARNPFSIGARGCIFIFSAQIDSNEKYEESFSRN